MLRLIDLSQKSSQVLSQPKSYGAEAEHDHHEILESYFKSLRSRNFSPHTQYRHKRIINGWLSLHGSAYRPLLIWEALQPVLGRHRIQGYISSLLEAGITVDTLRCYLATLSQLFSYVMEHPYAVGSDQQARLLRDLYGPFEHPISKYDMPNHSYDGEPKGVPMEPAKLYDFFSCIRNQYLNPKFAHREIRARNYAMVVLAGESGLRLEELMHLELDHDLYFESKKLQTRFGKASNGSGKRSRMSLFPPLARDTMTHYLLSHRRIMDPTHKKIWLFPSKTGNLLTHALLHPLAALMQRASKQLERCVQTSLAQSPFAP